MADVSPETAEARILAAIQRVRERIKNTGDLMKKIGALGVAASQKAFREQKLGDIAWPGRYPNQPDPFINIAGTLSDFNAGRTSPQPNRFERTPALVDQGQRGGIWGSLSWTSGNEFARWGTNKQYSRVHQEGGESEITVTPEAKKRLHNYFYGKKGERRRMAVGTRIKTKPYTEVFYEWQSTPTGVRQVRVEKIQKTRFIPAGFVEGFGGEREAAVRSDYIKKFGWLLNPATRDKSTVVVTNVHPRPFVGVTPEMERNVQQAITRHVEGGR